MKEGAYRIYVLTMLMIVYTFNFVDRVIVGILAEPIKRDLGLTDTQLGLMSGLGFALFYTVLGIPIARLADRTSRTWVITVSLAVWSGFTALCGQATSFMQLLLARVGVGVGEAGGVAPSFALVTDYFPPKQRARALAMFSFGIPIGTGLGNLLGGLVAAALNWRVAFLVVGIAGLVLAPIFRLTVREPIRGALDNAHARAAVAPPMREVWQVLKKKRAFLYLALGAASASVVGYGLIFWIPSFFIRVHGLTLTQTAILSGIGTTVFGILGIGLSGWYGDKLGEKSRRAYALVPAALVAIMVPFMFGTVLAGNVVVALLFFVVPLTLSVGWTGPTYAAVQQLVPPGMRATASAVMLFLINLIGIGGGTLFVGAMSDILMPRFGIESLRYAMAIATVFYVISALLFYLASRRIEAEWHRD